MSRRKIPQQRASGPTRFKKVYIRTMNSDIQSIKERGGENPKAYKYNPSKNKSK